MTRRLSVYRTAWRLRSPFRITGRVFEQVEPIVVEIAEDGCIGRGEGLGVYYLDETADSLLAEVAAVKGDVEAGLTREELLTHMPAGGARNAIDCALWDLEAKVAGSSVADAIGISLAPVTTVETIGIEPTVDAMAARARALQGFGMLKVKLDAEAPVERLRAIRAARPDAVLVVDANQAFDIALLERILPSLAELRIAMIEQPLPRGADDALLGFVSPIPLCADESCLHRGELEAAMAKYDMINIKLDKTGGLTEALALAKAARAAGRKLMVGNMMGSSLSMAPALHVAQLADLIDLDGPLHQCEDYLAGVTYVGDRVAPPAPGFWGTAA